MFDDLHPPPPPPPPRGEGRLTPCKIVMAEFLQDMLSDVNVRMDDMPPWASPDQMRDVPRRQCILLQVCMHEPAHYGLLQRSRFLVAFLPMRSGWRKSGIGGA